MWFAGRFGYAWAATGKKPDSRPARCCGRYGENTAAMLTEGPPEYKPAIPCAAICL